MMITKRLRQKWINAAGRMQKVMAEIGEKFPQWNLYVQENTFYLMSGDPHEGKLGTARTDRVVEQVVIPRCDCGAW